MKNSKLPSDAGGMTLPVALYYVILFAALVASFLGGLLPNFSLRFVSVVLLLGALVYTSETGCFDHRDDLFYLLFALVAISAAMGLWGDTNLWWFITMPSVFGIVYFVRFVAWLCVRAASAYVRRYPRKG